MVRFVDMSRAQAQTFLDGFRGELTPRVAALRSEAAASGGPSPRELDLTPASLGPLWAWAAPRLSWREGYEPPPGEPPVHAAPIVRSPSRRVRMAGDAASGVPSPTP